MADSHPLERLRDEATSDPEAFWRRVADEFVPWLHPPDRIFEPDPPTFRWFGGGLTNMGYSALDHQVEIGRGPHVALVAADERGGRRSLTYDGLLAEVRGISAALRGLGIGRGDRVTIYMPTSVEAIATMLAVVRVGAIHVVVFAGFGAGALGDRIRASGSRLVVASDLTYRKGKDVALEGIVDDALATEPGAVEHVVVFRRGPASSTAGPAGDGPPKLDWADFLAGGAGQPDGYEAMEANEPAYILATSGTTARPKLAVHRH
nr:AMP-binding protein [Chloroflexota bacterium]